MLIYQPQNGYCYNSDTHFLYNFITIALKKYKNIQGDLLDIGSGSGILGLLVVREYSNLVLNQCELQDVFCFLTNKNSQINNTPNTLFQGDFLDISFNKTFSYIVSNPPFYHSDVIKTDKKNIKIARYNDFMPLELFIQKVSKLLNHNGKFIFCYDVKQLNDIMIYLKKYKLNIEIIQFLHPNIKKEATLVMIYAKKNSKSLLKIIPPLIMFDENNKFSTTVEDIYEKSATHSIKCDLNI